MDMDDDLFKHLTGKLEQALDDDDDSDTTFYNEPYVADVEDSLEPVNTNVQSENISDETTPDGNPLNNIMSQLFQGDMMSNLMKQIGKQVKDNADNNPLDVPNEDEVQNQPDIPERDVKLSDCSDSVDSDSVDSVDDPDNMFNPVFKGNTLLFCDVFVLNANVLISIHIDNASDGYFRVIFNFGSNIISSSIYSNMYLKDARCGLNELSRR